MRKITLLLFFVAIATYTFAQSRGIISFQKINNNSKHKYNKNLNQIQAFDYFEDFEGATATITTVNVDGKTDNAIITATGANFSTGWLVGSFDGVNTIAASNSCFTPAGTANRWLFTPQITLTAANPTLSWKAQSYQITTPVKLEAYNVYVTTSIAGSTPAPGDFTSAAVFSTTTEQSASLVLHSVSLTYPVGTHLYVAFRHVSNDKYILTIDDIRVGTSIVNDLEVEKSFLDNTAFGYAGSIPRTQLTPITFSQDIKNAGSATQNNITLTVKVRKGWTSPSQVFMGTSPTYTSMASSINDTLTVTNLFTGATTGTNYEKYEADYSVATQGVTDDVPITNVDTIYFLSSDNDYSRCLNDYWTLNNTNLSTFGSGTNMIISNDFYFPNADIIDSIYTVLDSITSPTGVSIKGLLFKNIAGVLTKVDSTQLYSVTSGNLNNIIKLGFINAYNVNPGDSIRAGFRLTYATGQKVEWLTDEGSYIPQQAGWYYLPNASTAQGGPGWYWFYAGHTPYLGLLTNGGSVNVDNLKVSDNIMIYPNPTNGLLNIKNAENANVVVYNLLGEVVANSNCNSAFSTVDLSKLSTGTYIVKVISEKNIKTQKINIIK